MIGLRTNAGDFARELDAELEAAVRQGDVAMRKRIARHVRNRAEATSPRGQKRRKGAVILSESWTVAVGEPRLKGRPGSDAEAQAVMQNLQPDETVFVASTDFTSSFIEHGTAKLSPRPIVQAAIEETRSFVG